MRQYSEHHDWTTTGEPPLPTSKQDGCVVNYQLGICLELIEALVLALGQVLQHREREGGGRDREKEGGEHKEVCVCVMLEHMHKLMQGGQERVVCNTHTHVPYWAYK